MNKLLFFSFIFLCLNTFGQKKVGIIPAFESKPGFDSSYFVDSIKVLNWKTPIND